MKIPAETEKYVKFVIAYWTDFDTQIYNKFGLAEKRWSISLNAIPEN